MSIFTMKSMKNIKDGETDLSVFYQSPLMSIIPVNPFLISCMVNWK